MTFECTARHLGLKHTDVTDLLSKKIVTVYLYKWCREYKMSTTAKATYNQLFNDLIVTCQGHFSLIWTYSECTYLAKAAHFKYESKSTALTWIMFSVWKFMLMFSVCRNLMHYETIVTCLFDVAQRCCAFWMQLWLNAHHNYL